MLGKSWFGFGGSSSAASPEETLSTAPPPSAVDTAPTSNFATPLPAPNAAASFTSSPATPVTVGSLLADLDDKDKNKLNPAQFEDVELLYIVDNPFALQAEAKPTGSFGPLPMRTWSDKLLYGCGTAYLGGLSAGGAYGFIRGLQTAQVPAVKVRMNSVLNQVTRYGPRYANTMGILSMVWASLDTIMSSYRGKSDYGNHISAAFLSGAMFKSTAGLRPAVFTGTLLASIVGAYGVWDTLTTEGIRMPSLGGREAAAV